MTRRHCPDCGKKLEPIPYNSFKFRRCPDTRQCGWREPWGKPKS
jgi:hypothetical protein